MFFESVPFFNQVENVETKYVITRWLKISQCANDSAYDFVIYYNSLINYY